jgi:hypothetical protein
MESLDRLESFGIYKLARQLFEDFWQDTLNQIIGGLTKTIQTIESKPTSPVTRHSSPSA